MIDTEIKKVTFKKEKKTNSKGYHSFVVTYHSSIVCTKSLEIILTCLTEMKSVKNAFFLGTTVSFRRAPKLSSYLLVRAKLHPLHRTVESTIWAKNHCEACD